MNDVDVGVLLASVRKTVAEKFEWEIQQENPHYNPAQIKMALKTLEQRGLIDEEVLRQLMALNAHFTKGQTKKGRLRRAALGVGTLVLGYAANLLLNQVTAGQHEDVAFGVVLVAILVVQFVEVWTE